MGQGPSLVREVCKDASQIIRITSKKTYMDRLESKIAAKEALEATTKEKNRIIGQYELRREAALDHFCSIEDIRKDLQSQTDKFVKSHTLPKDFLIELKEKSKTSR